MTSFSIASNALGGLVVAATVVGAGVGLGVGVGVTAAVVGAAGPPATLGVPAAAGRLGGGQPISVGDSIAPVTIRPSATTAPAAAMTLRRRRRCRPTSC